MRRKEKWVGLREGEMKGTDVEGGAGAAVAHGRRERKEQRRREGSDGMKKMVRSEMCVWMSAKRRGKERSSEILGF